MFIAESILAIYSAARRDIAKDKFIYVEDMHEPFAAAVQNAALQAETETRTFIFRDGSTLTASTDINGFHKLVASHTIIA